MGRKRYKLLGKLGFLIPHTMIRNIAVCKSHEILHAPHIKIEGNL